MQRKDGLTKVFKMFLGEVAYKEKQKANDSVLVRAITYSVDDPEFNKVEIDYRGNPKYSTMISKLCNYNRRNEFLLKILETELKEKPDQQIMVLGHQKSLLSYLFDAIQHRNIASVGYYIGGMKEADLKKSEAKTIILATYAMASEGLDIKTLTTLVMVTPKTDITQSVGRILRVKHERPLIVDVIDEHEPFMRQWAKRRKVYSQNRYTIVHTNSAKYGNGEWDTLECASRAPSVAGGSAAGAKKASGCLITL